MPPSRDRETTAALHREALLELQRRPGGREDELGRAARRRGGRRRFADVEVAVGPGDRRVLELPGTLLVGAPGTDGEDGSQGLLEDAGLVPVPGLRGRVLSSVDSLGAGTDGTEGPDGTGGTGGSDEEAAGADPGRRARVDDLRSRLEASGTPVSRVRLTPTRVVMKSNVTPVLPPPGTPTPALVPAVDGPRLPVVVIDTGVRARTDGWLAGVHGPDNEDPLDVWPERNGFLDLAAGHGTFVAGLVQRADAGLDVSVVRVVDSDGLASELEVAQALVEAVDQRLEPGGRLVVNLSLGTETTDDRPPIALEAALAVVREIEQERGGDVLLVAAAGNDGTDTPCWPAAFAGTDPKVVAVAATGLDGKRADWSTRGDWVTCSTVGEAVLSTFVEGIEDPDFHPRPATDPADEFGTDPWAWWTGTSFAAPQVAGLVAGRARTSGSSLTDALAAVLAGLPTKKGYGVIVPEPV